MKRLILSIAVLTALITTAHAGTIGEAHDACKKLCPDCNLACKHPLSIPPKNGWPTPTPEPDCVPYCDQSGQWCFSCMVDGCSDLDAPGISARVCADSISWCTDDECGELEGFTLHMLLKLAQALHGSELVCSVNKQVGTYSTTCEFTCGGKTILTCSTPHYPDAKGDMSTSCGDGTAQIKLAKPPC